MLNLNRFLKIRSVVIAMKRLYLNKIWKMDISNHSTFSLSARFDKTNPKGIHIDAHTYVAFDATILSHDMVRRLHCDTWIGKNCFIGARSIILPGIRIGDGVIVAAGSVVTADVPDHSIVAGNPARIVRQSIRVGRYGVLLKDGEEASI